MTLHRRFQSPPPERRGRRRRCMAMTTRMYVVTNQHDEPLGLWLSETLIVTGPNAAEGAAVVWTASEGGEA